MRYLFDVPLIIGDVYSNVFHNVSLGAYSETNKSKTVEDTCFANKENVWHLSVQYLPISILCLNIQIPFKCFAVVLCFISMQSIENF